MLATGKGDQLDSTLVHIISQKAFTTAPTAQTLVAAILKQAEFAKLWDANVGARLLWKLCNLLLTSNS